MSKKSKMSRRLTYDESRMGWTRRHRPRQPTMDVCDGDPRGDDRGWSYNARDDGDEAPCQDTGQPEE
jgi:hypothetical protein